MRSFFARFCRDRQANVAIVFGLTLPFTTLAVVVAQVFVASPFYLRQAIAGVVKILGHQPGVVGLVAEVAGLVVVVASERGRQGAGGPDPD